MDKVVDSFRQHRGGLVSQYVFGLGQIGKRMLNIAGLHGVPLDFGWNPNGLRDGIDQLRQRYRLRVP